MSLSYYLHIILLAASFTSITALPRRRSIILPNTCQDVEPRLEIRDLERNTDQWNVFLLGMKRMKELDYTDPLSYYQLAGIHGYPYINYDDVQRCSTCFNNTGYCPHISHLFLVWHRPYLALFERTLRLNAMLVANEFPDGAAKDRYVSAAARLRLPYWDFAKLPPAGQNVLPPSVTNPTARVIAPRGNKTIPNPLLQFDFNGPHPNWDNLTASVTVRHPGPPPKEGLSRNDAAILAVNELQDPTKQDLRCGMYRLLFSQPDLNYFSGSLWDDGQIVFPYDNLESIHDSVHIAIGGELDNNTVRGTMWYINSAAFDPVFWMHHAMVDRIFGFWQVLYPDSWLESINSTSTWTIPPEELVNGTTPLTPFRSDTNGTFWTGDSSRHLDTFCYTYPDLSRNTAMDNVKATINRLYGSGCLVAPPAPPSVPSLLPSRTANATSIATLTPSPPVRRKQEVAGTSSQSSRSLVALSQKINNLVSDTGAVREYVANIRANAMALSGTFTVFLFDGPVTGSPITWRQSKSLLGRRVFLTSGKGATKEKAIVGTVTMTSALMVRVEGGTLSGMGNDEVAAYLKDKMIWKVVKGDGTIVSPKDVPGLTVSVITSDVQPATHERELPSWGTSRVLDEVTLGKPGGYGVNSNGFIGRDT